MATIHGGKETPFETVKHAVEAAAGDFQRTHPGTDLLVTSQDGHAGCLATAECPETRVCVVLSWVAKRPDALMLGVGSAITRRLAGTTDIPLKELTAAHVLSLMDAHFSKAARPGSPAAKS